MSDKTSLGDRMKRYELSTKMFLPRRTYTIIRVDGKAFHTYCGRYQKPFDDRIANAMRCVAQRLFAELQGAIIAYWQSDECSVVLYDFESIHTEPHFGGNLQKIVSVSASIATWSFSSDMRLNGDTRPVFFDARVFTIPDPTEVENYLIWRQRDATRNSISAAAQSVYSHRELQGKKSDELQEMLWQKDINWNDYPTFFKRGEAVFNGEGEVPVFTQDRDFLRNLIPTYDQCE